MGRITPEPEYPDYADLTPSRYPYAADDEDTQEVVPVRYPTSPELEDHIEQRRRRIVASAQEAQQRMLDSAWEEAHLDHALRGMQQFRTRHTYDTEALDFSALEAVEAEIAAQAPVGVRHTVARWLHHVADRLAS